MANVELIKQKLPQELWERASKFEIPDYFLENHPDAVILVLNSRSLSKDEEKQNRFNLVPMMNEEQISKLKDILIRERDKIAEIEEKYGKKKEEIREKYQARFDAVTYEKTMSNMKNKEELVREQEKEEAEDLLKNL
ncbi:MAG TPA: hypothetical protein PLP73_02015 [Candidatus Absconditabacterales bacterium]|nr:hypothetical protein [Candidatus Absconditabacterales bacterium]HRU49911.1 hypothetical protein [Candidatus Absconditabacterales bacterium]